MIITTQVAAQTLSTDSDKVILNELNLVQQTLREIFTSDDVNIPKTGLSSLASKIIEILEKVEKTKVIEDRLNIYCSEYRPISEEFKQKYQDFLDQNVAQRIEIEEKYLDLLISLFSIQRCLFSVDEEHPKHSRDRLDQIYTGTVQLAELIEKDSVYFSKGLIASVKDIALALLNEPDLRPNRDSQDEQTFGNLVAIKNTAQAILWQVRGFGEVKRSTSSSLNSLPLDPELERRLQIRKNQAAMDWTKARLEQLERIGQAKGYKYAR